MSAKGKSDKKFVSKIKKCFGKVSNFFDRLIFPDDIKCIFCGRDINDFYEKPYCEDCEKKIVLNNQTRCVICSEPIYNEAIVCDQCQKHKRSFKRAFCPFVYEGEVRKAILAYKDSNKRYLAKAFAQEIAKEIVSSNVKIDMITYVPLTDKKKKKRGFDQAELLAKRLGEKLNIPVVKIFKKDKDGISQKTANFKERQENTKDMYSLEKVKLKKADNVLIVDDIITTCATINTCASLISKKVNDVYVCAVARNKRKRILS